MLIFLYVHTFGQTFVESNNERYLLNDVFNAYQQQICK